jgi:hypothetical protein
MCPGIVPEMPWTCHRNVLNVPGYICVVGCEHGYPRLLQRKNKKQVSVNTAMKTCTMMFLKFPGPGPGVRLVVPVSGFWTKGICVLDLKCRYIQVFKSSRETLYHQMIYGLVRESAISRNICDLTGTGHGPGPGLGTWAWTG